jgi:hypothetical protein
MAKIPPIPYRVPLLDQRSGLLDRNWTEWFQALLDRIGGTGDIPGNDTLASLLSGQSLAVQTAFAAVSQAIQDGDSLAIFEPDGIRRQPADPFSLHDLLDSSQSYLHAVDARLTRRLHDLEALEVFDW